MDSANYVARVPATAKEEGGLVAYPFARLSRLNKYATHIIGRPKKKVD